MHIIANLGIVAFASLLVGILPLAMGVVYAVWPSEQRLLLMRPLSIAAIFASVSGLAAGLIYQLMYVSRLDDITFTRIVAIGTAESLVTVFVGFGSLSAAWLCVTVGLMRQRV